MLLTPDQANARIARGAPLIIAGVPSVLAGLQPGNWIGGSIPYFTTAEGGCCDQTRVFVDEIKLPVANWTIKAYPSAALHRIGTDAYDNGFSYVIIPANSNAHLEYAMHAPGYPDIFLKPMLGWIAGVHLTELATAAPVVFDGRTGACLTKEAIVLHVELPPAYQAMVQTVNLFRPGPGPVLRFRECGFSASTALVGGKSVDLVPFMQERGWDASRPLVADYAGTHVNVSIKSIDAAAGRVNFYAPVFPDVDYCEAAPVGDYVQAFSQVVPGGIQPVLSCNCILNYLYGKLEGQKTGPFTGPATFGEIAHQLLNQTLVYLTATKTDA